MQFRLNYDTYFKPQNSHEASAGSPRGPEVESYCHVGLSKNDETAFDELFSNISEQWLVQIGSEPTRSTTVALCLGLAPANTYEPTVVFMPNDGSVMTAS